MMKTQFTFLPGLILLLTQLGLDSNPPESNLPIHFGHCLHAQESIRKYPYKNYGDRKEGIVKSLELVGGEKLELISATIENEEPLPKTPPSHYKLVFYSPDASHVRVVVREFEKLYRMEPLFKTYPAGLRLFAWPSQIPRDCGIPITKLLPIAEVTESAGEKIVPVLLYCDLPKDLNLRYRFCFEPQSAVNLLEYQIYESSSLTLVYSGTPQRGLPAEKEVCLPWDGKAQHNKVAKNGWYYLAIKATFKPVPGANPVQIKLNYQFYHYAEILKATSTVRK